MTHVNDFIKFISKKNIETYNLLETIPEKNILHLTKKEIDTAAQNLLRLSSEYKNSLSNEDTPNFISELRERLHQSYEELANKVLASDMQNDNQLEMSNAPGEYTFTFKDTNKNFNIDYSYSESHIRAITPHLISSTDHAANLSIPNHFIYILTLKHYPPIKDVKFCTVTIQHCLNFDEGQDDIKLIATGQTKTSSQQDMAPLNNGYNSFVNSFQRNYASANKKLEAFAILDNNLSLLAK